MQTRTRCARRFRIILLCLVAAVGSLRAAPAPAQTQAAFAHQHSERKAFTDGEIIDGFMRTAFGAEYHLAGRVDRIRKYQVPVRVFASGSRYPQRRKQIAAIVKDIGQRVRHLDIALVPTRDAANVTVHLIRDRDFDRTMTKFYGKKRAREIRSSLDPQCLSGFRKNGQFAIQHSDVFLTVDNGDFIFYDCAYEELLQSLGPINDTSSVPWTMFNDEVQMGYFDIYDQYLLNILYDPRIKPGMTVRDVDGVLPEVLRDVRPWVEKINGLPRE